MKRIPDCPGGMGNANDWIKAREALGFPQDRTVSYEYTIYENNEPVSNNTTYTYEEGYVDGYEDALEDIKDALKTNLSSKSIKTALEAEPIADISVSKRYKLIRPIIDTVRTMVNANPSDL